MNTSQPGGTTYTEAIVAAIKDSVCFWSHDPRFHFKCPFRSVSWTQFRESTKQRFQVGFRESMNSFRNLKTPLIATGHIIKNRALDISQKIRPNERILQSLSTFQTLYNYIFRRDVTKGDEEEGIDCRDENGKCFIDTNVFGTSFREGYK